MTPIRRALLVVVPMAFAAGLVACSGSTTTSSTPVGTSSPGAGGDADGGSGSSTSAPPVSLAGSVNDHGTKDLSSAGSAADLALEVDDNYFSPTFVRVTPGATVHVEVENEGTREHTFSVDGTSVDATLAPGAKATLDVPVPSSGSLTYYCRIHRGSGMQGAFVTGAAGSGSSGGASASTTAPSIPTGRDGY